MPNFEDKEKFKPEDCHARPDEHPRDLLLLLYDDRDAETTLPLLRLDPERTEAAKNWARLLMTALDRPYGCESLETGALPSEARPACLGRLGQAVDVWLKEIEAEVKLPEGRGEGSATMMMKPKCLNTSRGTRSSLAGRGLVGRLAWTPSSSQKDSSLKSGGTLKQS